MLLNLLFSQVVSASYYAYIPDLSGKSVIVVNVVDRVIVETVPLFGNPRDIHINDIGSTVYISTVVQDGNTEQSYINVLNTLDLDKPKLIPIPFDNVRGMTVNQSSTDLYITHDVGVTRIRNPLAGNEMADLATSYRGKVLKLSNDEKYLFVLGQDEALPPNFGISVVETETMLEVATFPLGTAKNSNDMAYDNNLKKLFVVNQDTDELVSIQVNQYSDPTSINLSVIKTTTFQDRAGPIALALNEQTSELFIALSHFGFAQTETSAQEGYVARLNANDIHSAVLDIALSDEDSSYTPIVNIHPATIGITDSGNVFLVKQIWSDQAGLYISELRSRSGSQTRINEINSLYLEERASIFSTGKFIGPICTECPTGLDGPATASERPSALNPFLLIIFVIVVIFNRRYYNK